MIFAGIDPGKSGAVAFINARTGEGWGELVDTCDPTELRRLLRYWPGGSVPDRPVSVAIERVSASPQMGVSSAFKFGMAFGSCIAVVVSLDLPVVMVQPRAWQALAFQGLPKPPKAGGKLGGKASHAAGKARKAAVLAAARLRWPMASLGRVKDGAIADALWMAEWARVAHVGVA